MKQYICDNCKNIRPIADVILKGMIGTSTLLPQRYHEKHFCSPNCFWEWIEKYNPKNEHLFGGKECQKN